MMDLVTPCGEIANRRTSPIPYALMPVSYAIGRLADIYPEASIVPSAIPEGDTTYRIYYYVPDDTPVVN